MTLPAPIVERARDLDAVLFDFDGTLADTIPHILASFHYAAEKVLGHDISDEVLLQNIGIPLVRQMRLFTETDETAERLLLAYREFNHATHDDMARLYDGTLETLARLDACGPPLGIVSSKSTYMVTRGVELFGIGHYFKAIVTCDNVTAFKPDPYPVLHAAHMLGVDPTRCMYVGDSPHDVEAGLRAGALAVAATWGVSGRGTLEAAQPDVVLDDIRQVADLVCTEEAVGG